MARLLIIAFASIVYASTLTPPVLPLIVRNPYLSTWLPHAREEPWKHWPMFYTGASMGLSVLASVPETTTVYPLLGRAWDALDPKSKHYNLDIPTYIGATYDASTTNLTYDIPSSGNSGQPMRLVLSFLSPITPTSTLRQAIPASYVHVSINGDFDVAIYIDLNGQWVSGKRDSHIVWEMPQTNNTRDRLKTWRVHRKHEQILTETDDQAEWGTLHFTGPSDARHASGDSALLRQAFAKTGSLPDKVDARFRRIMDEEPVFAFSKHFNLSASGEGDRSSSSSQSRQDSVLFTIAHTQDPVTRYASARGLRLMPPLWRAYFPSEHELISHHYHDFTHAFALAANYSAQLAKDAYASGSDNYKDIVELSARQVMGATSFSGSPDNPLLFLKEISSNGNCQTVDVIFPSFPFFLYTNPRWLAYLLEPLLEHMLSGQYPNKYTMHDLGTHFPNLTGHPDGKDEYMPVEECGDMLIMALALVNSLVNGADKVVQSISSAAGLSKPVPTLKHANLSAFALSTKLESRDGVAQLDGQWGGVYGKSQARRWLERAYPLWKQWTTYLEKYALEPHNQVCTDDFAGPLALQTNLALKGIIGIRAMGQLSKFLGEEKDAQYYHHLSAKYIKKWEEYSIARDGRRVKLAYDWHGSWTTLYSLYADAILCFHPKSDNQSEVVTDVLFENQRPLWPNREVESNGENFIPDRIYKMQSRWYAAAMEKYGLPLDSRHTYTKSDWEFQAAAVASRKTRAEILDRVALWLNETVTDRPFTDLYVAKDDGGFPGPNFFARPVIGSHFAILALERACGGKGHAAFMYEV